MIKTRQPAGFFMGLKNLLLSQFLLYLTNGSKAG